MPVVCCGHPERNLRPAQPGGGTLRRRRRSGKCGRLVHLYHIRPRRVLPFAPILLLNETTARRLPLFELHGPSRARRLALRPRIHRSTRPQGGPPPGHGNAGRQQRPQAHCRSVRQHPPARCLRAVHERAARGRPGAGFLPQHRHAANNGFLPSEREGPRHHRRLAGVQPKRSFAAQEPGSLFPALNARPPRSARADASPSLSLFPAQSIGLGVMFFSWAPPRVVRSPGHLQRLIFPEVWDFPSRAPTPTTFKSNTNV